MTDWQTFEQQWNFGFGTASEIRYLYTTLIFCKTCRYSAIISLHSESTRGQLKCNFSADMFKAQGPEVYFRASFGSYTCQIQTMKLSSRVLKVMYSCGSADNYENKYWRYIILHCQPSLLLYLLLGSIGLQDNGPTSALRDSSFGGFRRLGSSRKPLIRGTVKYINIMLKIQSSPNLQVEKKD